MTLHKKAGMWISDWNVSDSADDEGCRERQREQNKKAKAVVAKLKTQGWKRIPEKKVNATIVENISSSELLTAMKKYNADVKKKWANKKVSTSIPGRRVRTTPAWKYHSFFPHGDVKSELQEWFSDGTAYWSLTSYWIGELGGYGALMNKGNQYRLIMTGGSDDDEAAHWSTPVFQLALKGKSAAKAAKPAAKKPKAKPRAKAPKTKKGFNWVDLDDEKTAEHPRETLTKSVKKATQDGWKQVSWMQSGGKREKQIWGKMAQSPQWNAWVKDFTARCKYEQIMSETYMVFNGTAHWKDTYDPDHMGEEGEWTILTKDNKVLLFYYYSDWENNTTVMRKTFNLSPVKATKTAKKAKPKAAKKSTAKAKPKAKPKTKYVLGKKDRPTDVKKRKSPPYSAKQFPKGARKKGNNGKMWTIVTDKRGVKRWKA